MGLSNMQKEDFKWYADNFYDLYKKYGKSFVVIGDKKVLGSYPTEAEGVHSMDNKNVDFIVQVCAPTKEEIMGVVTSMHFM